MIVYSYSPFRMDPAGHGGEKRSYQIEELLTSLDLDIQPLILSSALKSSRIERFISYIKNYKLIKTLNIPIKTIKEYRILSNNILDTKLKLSYLEPGSIIIYEHHLSLNWIVPICLKQLGYKLIAFPHNLETLVPEQRSTISGILNPNGLFEEIQVLKSAGLVLTMSKEEEWLLNLFGVNSVYFPYNPSDLELQELQRIALLRKGRNPQKRFLILGTAFNPPTKLGITELLSILDNPRTKDMTFHVAGYGTENMVKEKSFPDRFIFHGSINKGKLYELYKIVDASIVHQKPTTGALTKIPEFLFAGIHVIANNHAARNYFNRQGVKVYRDIEELFLILEENLDNNFVYIHEDGDLGSIKNQIERIVYNV